MDQLKNIITPLHKQTKRDYVGRMVDDKIKCSEIARKYDYDYWDGNRKYGYGGYKYDGRWSVVAEKMIELYDLKNDAKILDVGCGKGFLLYELKKLLPEAEVVGIDISTYALMNAKDEIKPYLREGCAQGYLDYGDDYFDLAYSVTTLHNLKVFDLKKAVREIQRVGKKKYIMVESYRNVEELFNLQCWALTCEAFFSPEEWIWLFKEFGYTGDYEFIYFE